MYLVADDLDHGFHIQGLCHGFAHAVEDGKFVHAGVEFFGAFFHLLFKPLCPLGIVQSHGPLIGQHAEHIPVSLIKCAIQCRHIHVQIAEKLILGDERCHDDGFLTWQFCA